jgi:predicted ArsR family transcriptional regulator
MSSKNLENKTSAVRVAERLLMLLKTRGAQSAATLGDALGTTGEAARQQLVKLAADGLVESESQSRGVGRPMQLWRLTATGNARFPDTHADLTVQLLRSIRNELGEEALDRLITIREMEARANYETEFLGLTSLEEKVARLAAIRTSEGYMAEWHVENGGYLLVENHCPICAAATACIGFCRAELDLFRTVLGPGVTVERIEHIPQGARRCAYRIMPSK